MASIPKQDRYAHIDSLRAIAALLVIWMHVSEVFVTLQTPADGSTPLLQTIPSTVDTGRIGVLMFFLISGFLIPSSLKGTRKEGAKTFLIRRFFRLYPLYWVSIPLSLITMWWMFGKSMSATDIALNFTMLQEKFHAKNISGLYWTLRVELYFYALCLGLFCLNLLKREKVLAFLAIGILPTYFILRALSHKDASLWGTFWALWSKDVAFLSFMFAGALWRRAHDGQLGTIGKLALAGFSLWFTAIFPLLALYLFLRTGTLHPDHVRLFASYTLANFIFIIGAMLVQIRWKILAWMGKISYSMYLLHPVIFYTLFWYIVNLPAEHWLRNQPLALYLISSALLTIGISGMTYAWIEKPMINLGGRLTSRSKKVASQQPQPVSLEDGLLAQGEPA